MSVSMLLIRCLPENVTNYIAGIYHVAAAQLTIIICILYDASSVVLHILLLMNHVTRAS